MTNLDDKNKYEAFTDERMCGKTEDRRRLTPDAVTVNINTAHSLRRSKPLNVGML
jgi:hypothetical protein